MVIIISKDGKNAKRIEKSSIERETHLQEYIYDNPNVIPLYDIKEDINVCILAREVPTNSGPMDAIGLDENGEIYIIETKLFKNPDKRQVVAQALDYGASLWGDDGGYESIIRNIENSTYSNFHIQLNQRLMEYFALSDDEEVDILLDNFKTNLNEGTFKFIVLMDRIDKRLKDLILFINQNSQFDIYAVELEFYKHEEYEIIIPRIFGAEVKKNINARLSSPKRRKWTKELFFDEINNQLSEESARAVKRLYEFSEKYADRIDWGTGAVNGSFNPKLQNISDRSLYTVFSNGKLKINIGWLYDNEKTKKLRDKYYVMVRNVETFSIPEYSDLHEVYPKVPVECWAKEVDVFIEIIKTLITEGNATV